MVAFFFDDIIVSFAGEIGDGDGDELILCLFRADKKMSSRLGDGATGGNSCWAARWAGVASKNSWWKAH